MQHNSPKTFPRIIIKRTTLEPHSRLAHLKPIGIGTPLVESLTSYISRLAEIHCWKLGTLFKYELLPHLDMPYLLARSRKYFYKTAFSFWRARRTLNTVNGTSYATVKFIKALELLTKRGDLGFLTLSTWGDVFTPRELLRKDRLWCPDCFTDWRSTKQTIYEPLLWIINEVKICFTHQKYLVSTCPHCNNQAWLLSSKSRVGYCPICEKWLGRSSSDDSMDNTPTEAELHFQLWVVKNVGEILALESSLQSLPSQDNIKKSISSIIDGCYEGVAQRLAVAMGKSKSTVWGWKYGANKPTLREMLIICYLTRVLS